MFTALWYKLHKVGNVPGLHRDSLTPFFDTYGTQMHVSRYVNGFCTSLKLTDVELFKSVIIIEKFWKLTEFLMFKVWHKIPVPVPISNPKTHQMEA